MDRMRRAWARAAPLASDALRSDSADGSAVTWRFSRIFCTATLDQFVCAVGVDLRAIETRKGGDFGKGDAS